MKKVIIISVLIILGLITYIVINTSNTTPSNLVRECPDEMIVNKMPGTSPQSSYYILDGNRREISEFDSEWVKNNCNIKVQEVF
jgi:hypothetical protein